MTTQTQPTQPRTTQRRPTAAVVGVGLASVVLMLYGLLGIMQGVAAIARGQVYTVIGSYVFKFSLTAWGAIHLALGVVLLLTGVALVTGSFLARIVAIAFTALAILANFLYLPYQPFWSIVMIGIGLFVIWSLYRDVRSTTDPAAGGQPRATVPGQARPTGSDPSRAAGADPTGATAHGATGHGATGHGATGQDPSRTTGPDPTGTAGQDPTRFSADREH
ncbi:MAG TPA: hypothetical protein VF444_09040 [Pseudonocardiaceae bacterium]